jgi:hypothetical protein
VVWAALLILRAVGAFAGLDRLPLLPSVPAEVLINDPAVALSEGRGLVGPGFEHSINGLDKMYAHFPPVFITLQSLVYRVFGFSAFTLRALGGFDGLLAFALFLAVFHELYRQGIIDRLGIICGSVLLLLEPTTLFQARQGRMESTNILFGALAVYLTVRASRSRHELPLWIASAAASGFSLATHPSGMLFVPVLAAWSLPRLRRYGIVRWLAVNALPLAVFGAVWLSAYGIRALDAVKQMQHLASYSPPPSLALSMLAGVVRRGAVAELQQTGGFALVSIVVAPVLGCLRFFSVLGSGDPVDASPRWRRILAGSAAVLIVQCLLIAFVLPWSGPNRIVMAMPFAFLCLAIALSHLPRLRAKAVLALASLALVAEVALIGGYFLQLRSGAADRGPDRFDAIVDSIPNSIEAPARVAAVPEFWFAFHHRGRPVSLIYHALDESRYWNETPGAFDAYDAVILDPATPDYANLLARARPGKPLERVVHTWRRDFTVLERK